MKTFLSTIIALAAATSIQAQSFNFSFDGSDKSAIQINNKTIYNQQNGYGFDFIDIMKESRLISDKFKPENRGNSPYAPFFFSIKVPDGNYKVTVTLGAKKFKSYTTVRAESRRLFLHDITTDKGETKTFSFIVNKRNTEIWGTDKNSSEVKVIDHVRIKEREKNKLNWDDKLTIEITGDQPACASIRVEPANDVTTLFLCGNSTVVDQDYEPWASWGQMITRWFDQEVAVANFAESGETASTFIAAGRLKKILSMMKEGDYVFVEFGHNDQKQKFPGAGAYYNFAFCLKQFIDEARARKANIVFVTPTQRRSFDENGKIRETHGDYPNAMRQVAKRENVPIIELHDMTRTFYETMGIDNSTKAFVHYPANTYPDQEKPLADNTHFNTYGAYEIAKMVIEGIKNIDPSLATHITPEYQHFNPQQPDNPTTFHWNNSPFTETLKPDGN